MKHLLSTLGSEFEIHLDADSLIMYLVFTNNCDPDMERCFNELSESGVNCWIACFGGNELSEYENAIAIGLER